MKIMKVVHPAEDAGRALASILQKHGSSSILLMVSGGSAFKLLDYVEPSVLGPHLTLTVLDERFSRDPTVNNFSQLKETPFYKTCMKKGVHTLSTKVEEGETLPSLSARWGAALSHWKEEHPHGSIIATMGMGVDGHTAGIFPDEHNTNFNDESWVVGYTLPRGVHEYTERITVTYTFLTHQVDEAIVYAVGSEKREVVERIQGDDCDSFRTPACIVRQMNTVTLFTDKESL